MVLYSSIRNTCTDTFTNKNHLSHPGHKKDVVWSLISFIDIDSSLVKDLQDMFKGGPLFIALK